MTIIARASLVLALIACAAAASAKPDPAPKPKPPAVQHDVAVHPTRGELAFQANCGRCHSAPEQFSPSIGGTIIRHMRVRAGLSAQDEKEILRYLAP